MSNIILTGRDIVSRDIDPLDINIDEIKDLSNLIPRDGHIDLNIAEELATKFLRGMDLCSELSAMCLAEQTKRQDEKARAYNRAIIKTANQPGLKTDKMRTAFAEVDQEYIDAQNELNKIKAFSKFIDGKFNSFKAAHYLCKNMLDRGYGHERASNWNGSLREDDSESEEKLEDIKEW